MPTCATRLVVLLFWLVPALARAEGPLQVELPKGCPDVSRFHERLGELLGARPSPTKGHVQVRAEANGYRLVVETADVSRTLVHEDCAELVDTAAVIVALGAAAAEAPAPSPVEAAPPAAAPPAPVPVEKPAPRTLALWLEASAAYGLVPRVALRPALGVSYGGSRFGGTLGLDYVQPRTTPDEQGVRVQAAGANLGAYLAFSRLTVSLGGALHMLWGRGQGVHDARSGHVPLGSARLALTLALVERRSLRLALVLAGAVPLSRGRFRFADGGTAYRPDVVHGSLGLAFGFVRAH